MKNIKDFYKFINEQTKGNTEIPYIDINKKEIRYALQDLFKNHQELLDKESQGFMGKDQTGITIYGESEIKEIDGMTMDLDNALLDVRGGNIERIKG